MTNSKNKMWTGSSFLVTFQVKISVIVTLLIFNCNSNSQKPETKSYTLKKRFEVIWKSLISFLKCILKSNYIHVHIYTHTHTHTYIYAYIYIHTHTHTYIYICIYIYTYIHVLIHINICTYTHTHIHIHYIYTLS